MNLIYKDNNFKILIDFYKKPAVIELYEKYNGNITHITVNGDYIDGDKNKAIKLYEWLESSKKEFENIIWEWEIGNDNYNLINNKFIL